MSIVTEPIILDDTGKEIVNKLQGVIDAIGGGGGGGSIPDHSITLVKLHSSVFATDEDIDNIIEE